MSGLVKYSQVFSGMTGMASSVVTIWQAFEQHWAFAGIMFGVALISFIACWLPFRSGAQPQPQPESIGSATAVQLPSEAEAPISHSTAAAYPTPLSYDEPMPNSRKLNHIQCPICKGNGREWGRYETVCSKCKGRGHIQTYRVGQPMCPPCAGSGRNNGRYAQLCPVCEGVGLLPFKFRDTDKQIGTF